MPDQDAGEGIKMISLALMEDPDTVVAADEVVNGVLAPDETGVDSKEKTYILKI